MVFYYMYTEEVQVINTKLDQNWSKMQSERFKFIIVSVGGGGYAPRPPLRWWYFIVRLTHTTLPK